MYEIYVIGPSDGPFKIGYSSNTEKRLATLQTSHYAALSIVARAPTANCREIEHSLHNLLSDYRLSGEWFSCPLETILSAMRERGLEPNAAPVPDADVYVPGDIYMTGTAFQGWVEDMFRASGAKDQECARLLGVSSDIFDGFKRTGCNKTTALACRAVYHRFHPYA